DWGSLVSLSVNVLPVDPLPIVRLLVSLPSGRSWRVTGSAGDTVWLAGEGVSSGLEVAFADPWAPLGVPASYVLTSGTGQRSEAGPVVRTFRGDHAVTDLTGRSVVDFRWGPGDPWEPEPRVSFLDPWGSELPVPTVGGVAGAGGGQIVGKTVRPHTRTMAALVAKNRTLLLLHNDGVCRMPDCDVPLVRTVLLTGAPAERTGRADTAERSWTLSYRLIPKPYKFLAPVATWADVQARWSTNAELLATGMTNLQLARGDWLVEW